MHRQSLARSGAPDLFPAFPIRHKDPLPGIDIFHIHYHSLTIATFLLTTDIEIWKDTKIISFEPLNGGLVNCTFKIKVDDIFYVLRINGGQNNFLKLKREDEVKAIQKASEMGDMKYMNMLREISWGLLHSGMEVKKVNHNFNYYENALWFLERLKNGFVSV